MKVLAFSGSPRKGGNTDRLIQQVLDGAKASGAETEFVRVADLAIKGCVDCRHCRTHDTCAVKDDMQALYPKLHTADAVVIGSPIYMGQVSGQLKLFFDRLFPLVDKDYETRLRKRPALVLVFTQGMPDPNHYAPYFEQTRSSLEFMGFTPRDILACGGTHEKDDIERQKDLLARARSVGAALAQPAPR